MTVLLSRLRAFRRGMKLREKVFLSVAVEALNKLLREHSSV